MPAHADRTDRESLNQVVFAPAPPPGGDPLAPYIPSAAKPWNARRVAHVYRRLGFGANLENIQQGLALSPSALIDKLLDEAAGLDIPAPPFWAGYTLADYDGNQDLIEVHRREVRERWFTDMIGEGVRAKTPASFSCCTSRDRRLARS